MLGKRPATFPPVDKQVQFDSIAAGAMAQSVGLVAASEGLGTCVRGSIDHEAFAKVANLQKGQTVVIAQTIGVLP
ncbi:Nitroreductase family protein [Selenomonas sp. KH1T6]|nr:Nitroreductase family protein [Selenomonas ruminantium]